MPLIRRTEGREPHLLSSGHFQIRGKWDSVCAHNHSSLQAQLGATVLPANESLQRRRRAPVMSACAPLLITSNYRCDVQVQSAATNARHIDGQCEHFAFLLEYSTRSVRVLDLMCLVIVEEWEMFFFSLIYTVLETTCSDLKLCLPGSCILVCS